MLLATDSISCVAWDDWISSALRIIVIDTASPVRVGAVADLLQQAV
jgi:hypothetical protein